MKPTCTGPECDRPAVARKLCGTHVKQLYAGNGLSVIGTTHGPRTRVKRPEPGSNLPKGWFKPAPEPKRERPQAETAAVPSVGPIPVVPDALSQALRRHIERRFDGTARDELLDMLGYNETLAIAESPDDRRRRETLEAREALDRGEELAEVAERYDLTPAGLWSRLRRAGLAYGAGRGAAA